MHKKQAEPSYFGGKITGYKVQKEGVLKGRVIFQFIAAMNYKNVKAGTKGWEMEKKLVRGNEYEEKI